MWSNIATRSVRSLQSPQAKANDQGRGAESNLGQVRVPDHLRARECPHPQEQGDRHQDPPALCALHTLCTVVVTRHRAHELRKNKPFYWAASCIRPRSNAHGPVRSVRSALDGALPTTTPSAFQLVVAWRRCIVPELPACEPPGERVQLGGRDDGHGHSQACSGAASSDCDSRQSVYHLSPHSPLSESICSL